MTLILALHHGSTRPTQDEMAQCFHIGGHDAFALIQLVSSQLLSEGVLEDIRIEASKLSAQFERLHRICHGHPTCLFFAGWEVYELPLSIIMVPTSIDRPVRQMVCTSDAIP